MTLTLNKLKTGQSASIVSVGGEGSLRQHFLDMGLIPGADVTLIKLAPMGDPMELRIHSYELTLRLADAEKIEIDRIRNAEASAEPPVTQSQSHHPGLGEAGIYHTKSDSENTLVTDLPGIYSMSPYSSEELVTRQFLLESRPKAIINIADATNIERNLYLTMQLMELDIPMVLALNMMDEVKDNGGSIRVNEMEAMLGIPVIPISAARNEGIQELIDHAVHIAQYQERPGRWDFCSPDDHDGAVHRCLHAIMHLIEDHARRQRRRVVAGRISGDICQR